METLNDSMHLAKSSTFLLSSRNFLKIACRFSYDLKTHTQNKASIKFFLGGPENLISCSAFWPSVCELSSDVLVCQEFPHIEDTEACLKCVNLLPSLFAFIIISGWFLCSKKKSKVIQYCKKYRLTVILHKKVQQN